MTVISVNLANVHIHQKITLVLPDGILTGVRVGLEVGLDVGDKFNTEIEILLIGTPL